MKPTKIFARQIFDSRGNPTIEVDVTTSDGVFRAAVPSGASTGIYEALELRDGNKNEYLGKGVSKAINNVNSVIAPALIAKGINVVDQAAVDKFLNELDGTPKKSKLGANAILGVSMAITRAGAAAKKVPLYRHIADLANVEKITLPCPLFNIINGGAHASNPIAFQEFMIMPVGANSFSEAMKMGAEVYQNLKIILSKKYNQDLQVGDEGGFAPNFETPAIVLGVINEAIEASGHTGKILLAIDVAASEFYDNNKYDLDKKKKDSSAHCVLTGSELVKEYCKLKEQFPMLSLIEDPFDQDDWESWKSITESLEKTQIVGDDLTVTSIDRITEAIEKKACNVLLLKINQIGTVMESIEAANLVRANGWGILVSHRSGETEDTFISDLVVGLGAGQIKSGAPCRSERLAKYNALLRIEEELGENAVYACNSRS